MYDFDNMSEEEIIGLSAVFCPGLASIIVAKEELEIKRGNSKELKQNFKKMSLRELIGYKIANADPRLIYSLKGIYKYLDRIYDKRAEESSMKLQEASKKYLEEEKKALELAKELAKMGIKLSDNYNGRHYAGKKVEDGKGSNGHGEYTFETDRILPRVVMCTFITSEMLKNKVNPYDELYKEWQNKKESIEQEIQKLEEMISNGNNDSALKYRLVSLRGERLIGEDCASRWLFFEKLTAEQRTKLIEYIEQVEKCEIIGKKIEAYAYKCFKIKTNGIGAKGKLFRQALEKAIEEGTITEDELKTLDIIVDLDEPKVKRIVDREFFDESMKKYEEIDFFSEFGEWYCLEKMKDKRNKKSLDYKKRNLRYGDVRFQEMTPEDKCYYDRLKRNNYI